MTNMPPPFPGDSYSPPASPGVTQLKIAAIISIVGASLGWIWSLIDGAGRAMIIFGSMPMPAVQGATPETASALNLAFFVLDIITLFLAPVVIFGAVQALRRKMYGFVKMTSILGMLPIGAHCCCVITLPMGIWSLVLLARPDVKDAFGVSHSENR